MIVSIDLDTDPEDEISPDHETRHKHGKWFDGEVLG
jgi:hypothetical protein